MRERAAAFRDAFAAERALLCYAVKANSNLAVIRLFADEGLGADTVSGGEIARALKAGVPPQRIVYAGIAKTDDEIRFALATGILQFNVEFDAGAAADRRARLRHGPDRHRWPCASTRTSTPARTRRSAPAAGTTSSASPTTRRRRSIDLAASLPGIEPVGVHLHIGSQIGRLEPFEAAYRRAVELFTSLRGRGIPLRRLDLGGGFGVRYLDEPRLEAEALAALVRRVTAGLDCELLFEPGPRPGGRGGCHRLPR